MSRKNDLLTFGLTALGLSTGFVALRAADPASPEPPGASASAAAPAAPAPAVLLLSDGRVLQGFLSENREGYLLKVKGGEYPFRKHQVEKVFGSLDEIYQYKRARLPDRDPDERMKLARWCLTNHLNARAKEQLQAVRALSPKSAQAQRMLAFMQAEEDRVMFRDEAVQRAGAVVEKAPADPAVARAANHEFAGVGLPTIFNLPTALAVRRAEDFDRNVHPVLQMYCARCHNERYQGDYQLIQVQDKNKRDLPPTVLRANLEATLRLIDPESPARSELLSSALVPHGQTKRPIFASPRDPSYQRIWNWVNSLQAPRPADEASRTGFSGGASGRGDEETFAADRVGQARAANREPVALPFTPTPPPPASRPLPVAPTAPDEVIPQPPGQFLPGSGSGTQPDAPPNTEFPVPYLQGGPKPKLGTPPAAGEREDVPIPGATRTDTDPAGTAAPKKPTKPVKVDPALLEKALMNRYAPR